ncbi:MTH1187 family thiamine-binding protein [Candidatus Neomarinimicrobiota bacterium]
MKVIADFCIVPIGVGVSLSEYITACEQILAGYPVRTHLHAYGTNIEGEWNEVFAAIKQCHDKVHSMGAPRISSTIRIGTRIDREQTMDAKVASVRNKLGS